MFASFLDLLWSFWFPPEIGIYTNGPTPDPYGKTNRLPCVSGCTTTSP